MTKDTDANAPDAPDEAGDILDLAAARARVAAATEIAWIWDPARLSILDANPAALAFWGVADIAAAAALHFPADDVMARALSAADPAETGGGPVQFSVLREADAAALTARLTPVDLGGGRRGSVVRVVAGDGAGRRAAALGERAAAVAEAAAAALIVSDADGALIWRNAAARRLLGADATRFDALFDNPARGAALRRAALVSGAARRVARLRAADRPADAAPAAPERRRDVVVTRLAGLETGDWDLLATFLGPVSARAVEDVDRASDPSKPAPERADAAARAAAMGLGRFVFAVDDARLTAADAGARAILARGAPAYAVGDAATLWTLFPHDHDALEAAWAAARDGGAARLDLTLGGERPGPWLRAALSIAGAAATLDVCDLAAERRSLLRLVLEAEDRAAALDAVGVGVMRLDASGRVREADPAAARLLGRSAAALIGAEAAALFDDKTARRLTRYLRDGPVQEGRALEKGVDAAVGRTDESLRLAIAAPRPGAPGRRFIAVASAPPDARADPPADETDLGRLADARAHAHAIRTELTTVRGFAELMRDAPEIAAAPLLAAYVDDIVEAADRIAALIEAEALMAEPAAAVAARAEDIGLADASGPLAPLETTAPVASAAVDATTDLAQFLRDVADTLAIGARPDAAPVIAVRQNDPSRPVRLAIRDRAALREWIEIVIGLAPSAERGRLELTVSAPTEARPATLVASGPAGRLGADERTRRLLELLADRFGAAAQIAESGDITLTFPGGAAPQAV